MSTDRADIASLPRRLDGAVHVDEAARAAAGDDFGHIVHRSPDGVVVAGSAGDIVDAIRWTAGRGGHLAAQGQRHSTFGRAQVRDGVVADMRGLRDIGPVARDRVTVGAGATWGEVLAATLREGTTPPVLPDYLGLSVGGTLVVGGVGDTSWRSGLLSDNVIAMEVVTGTGELLTCSATEHADLFDAVRAGLGQVAVITAATIRLTPAPEAVRWYHLSYPDLGTMLQDERLLARDGRFEALEGAIVPVDAGGFAFRIEAARFVTGDTPADEPLLAGLRDERALRKAMTLTYADYRDRLAALERALRANGQWFFPHPWLNTFVGDAQVERVAAEEVGRLHPATDLGEFGRIVLFPLWTRAIGSPLVRLPSQPLVFTFNLLRVPPTDDPHEADRLVRDNAAAYRRITAAGGTLFPVSALPLSPGEWRRHFGPAFPRLAAAKRRYDPGNMLTPGYPVFPPGAVA